MCIACELGYWSMLDALEAERRISREKTEMSGATRFLCEEAAELQPRELPSDPSRELDRE